MRNHNRPRSKRPHHHRRVPGAALAAMAAGLVPAAARAANPMEDGFEVATYAAGLDLPIALDFAPDGRLFVGEKGGAVRIIENGAPRPTPFVTVAVHDLLESGLLGLAIDPLFEVNHFVYVFATMSFDEQQIIRYTEVDGVATEPTVIRDHLPSAGTFHNGGGLEFGPDGKLYFSIGDNTVGDNAQDLSTLAGKICRINPDGSTPADNPLTTPTGAPRAIWALGFRNPFRFCLAPDGRLFALDVGSDGAARREEVNLVRPGDNGGWPEVEGQFDGGVYPDYLNPIYEYVDEGTAPAGAVFYSGEHFPEEYRGDLFHLEYTLNRLYRVRLDGDRAVSHSLFVQGEGGPVDLTIGPDGAMYYCELFTGDVKRVSHRDGAVPDPDAPVAPPCHLCAVWVLCGSGLPLPFLLSVCGLASCLVTRQVCRAPR